MGLIRGRARTIRFGTGRGALHCRGATNEALVSIDLYPNACDGISAGGQIGAIVVGDVNKHNAVHVEFTSVDSLLVLQRLVSRAIDVMRIMEDGAANHEERSVIKQKLADYLEAKYNEEENGSND